jgi:ubiquinone/menaquinone biosynthesis C-methylase UbiE
MAEKLDLKQIRDFWTSQAIEHGQSPAASWSDQMVIEMEIREISKYLSDGDQVLDIGCANGYSTVAFAIQKQINIRGLDIIPEMIEQANLRLSGLTNKCSGTVEFGVGDIISLNEASDFYDKVVVTRVLINLGDWNNQLEGLHQCVRVLKRGGTLLLSEATLQGWRRLNEFRREWGLSDISMPAFNQYLDQEVVIEESRSFLQLVEVLDFASTYYVGTRVLKPLLANIANSDIDVADPNMILNQWLASLPSYGDFGTQKLFVFQKV